MNVSTQGKAMDKYLAHVHCFVTNASEDIKLLEVKMTFLQRH